MSGHLGIRDKKTGFNRQELATGEIVSPAKMYFLHSFRSLLSPRLNSPRSSTFGVYETRIACRYIIRDSCLLSTSQASAHTLTMTKMSFSTPRSRHHKIPGNNRTGERYSADRTMGRMHLRWWVTKIDGRRASSRRNQLIAKLSTQQRVTKTHYTPSTSTAFFVMKTNIKSCFAPLNWLWESRLSLECVRQNNKLFDH